MNAMWWGLIMGAVFGALVQGVAAALVLGFLGWLGGVIVDSRRKRAAPTVAPAKAGAQAPPDRVTQLEMRVAELEARLVRLEGGAPAPEPVEVPPPTPLPEPESPPPIPEQPAPPVARSEPQPNPLLAWLTGGNAIARVGIIVLFIGVAFLLRYAVDEALVPREARVAGVGALALVLLVVGWKLRDTRPGYALSLQGAGVGLLYLTIYGALRLYAMLPESVAFALLVAVAILATVLAIRQDAAVLAGFGAAGGFLAPVLASAGPGEPAVLFGYYAVLNLAVLATAWFRSWRSLNLIGMVFTFALGLVWGMEYYQPEHFATVEPFLAFFFLLYVAVAVIFARGEAEQPANLVDAAVTFGAPLGAIALQSGLMESFEHGLAWSSAGLAVFYAVLAAALRGSPREGWKALSKAFFALAVVFATLAIPLAFEARWTSAAWALEGAAVVWYGTRQERRLAVAFGILLQLLAGGAHFIAGGGAATESAIANAPFLGAMLLAVAGLVSHLGLRRIASAFSTPAFAWCIAWWVIGTFTEASRFLPRANELPAQLAITAATAAGFAAFHGRFTWREAAWPSDLMVPAMVLFLIAQTLAGTQHPFAGGGAAAWGFAAGAHLAARRLVEPPRGLVLNPSPWLHHACFLLAMVALLSWELHWQMIEAGLRRSGWASPSLVVVPALAMLLVAWPAAQRRWPIAAHAAAYQRTAMVPLALAIWVWGLSINALHNGRSTPLPYIPFVNGVDLGQMLAFAALIAWWRSLRHNAIEPPSILRGRGLVIAAGAAAFAWANGILLRSLHHWADVAYRLDAWMKSFITQASLSIFWSALALAMMVWATRRALRGLWMVGAALMAVVVVKLFFVDFAHLGGLERVASFIGVGLLMLAIGYLAPVPPKAESTGA